MLAVALESPGAFTSRVGIRLNSGAPRSPTYALPNSSFAAAATQSGSKPNFL